jgi:5-formyltetrahydrofolate cyclo-ligase
VVAGYWPFRSEIDPRPLMQRFVRAGWRVALPVTPAKGAEAPLIFRLWDGAADMARHPFGMSEPHPTAEAVRPDVVLVPLLAFDNHGHRLGYGAGHYDRTLVGLRASGPVRVIGLAFAGQQVERLPAEPHDQPLDAILTERRFTEFAKPAG